MWICDEPKPFAEVCPIGHVSPNVIVASHTDMPRTRLSMAKTMPDLVLEEMSPTIHVSSYAL
jgi:hypothetical protein